VTAWDHPAGGCAITYGSAHRADLARFLIS
jgi:hypothetical protein